MHYFANSKARAVRSTRPLHGLSGLGAPILTARASSWNAEKAGGLGWKVRQGGPYSGAGDVRLARDLYCFIHETNMLRKALGSSGADWEQVRYCEGTCNPDVMQGTKEHNCYNRDGMLGTRALAELANVIGVNLAGDRVVFPSGRDWGAHWNEALDLSRTKYPPEAGKMYIPPAASGPAGWVVATGQQEAAVDACKAQGGKDCAPPPPPSTPPKKDEKTPVKPTPKKTCPQGQSLVNGVCTRKKLATKQKPVAESNTGMVVGLLAAAAGAYYLTQS